MSVSVSIIKQWLAGAQWNGMYVEGSGHGLSEVLLQHLLEGTKKSQWKSTDKNHTRYYHTNQSLQWICIILSITVTRTSALFISQSTSVCPYTSSYHNSLQVHILHASKCDHMHSSTYLHSPSSSTVHLCWCKCSVKVRWWASYCGEDPT